MFGLYDKNNKLVCEVEVDDTGVGHTTNISDGNYTLVELVPPPGYTKDSTPIPVTANWTSATTWSKHSAKREIYTVDPNEALDAPNPEQIGWLVGEGTNADFYDLTPTGTNKPVVTDFDEETQTAKIDGVLVENVYKAYLKLRVTTESETENTVYNNNGGTISLARVNNSKTPKLPSTGGIGTYMFTIAGVAILALASFMLIFRKKEQHQ